MKHFVDLKNKTTPAWAAKIDRWYQLDEVSYSFCEALYSWDYLSQQPKPTRIFLALEGASNLADFEFVATNASSPSKFVYTLPNICGAVLLQLLESPARIFCFHKGKETFEFARQEAAAFARNGEVIWLLMSSPVLQNEKRQVEFELYAM